MNAIQALTILLVIFAFGEIIADKTKAILSTTLVVAVVLLIGFWCGLPADIFDTAAITRVSMTLVGLLITHLGTMMDFEELGRQWKTVIIGLGCVACATILIVVAGPAIMGREMALAGAPIFAGSNVAALMMTQALEEKGFVELSTFVILVLITQNFVGIPIASSLLRKEAVSFLGKPNEVALYLKNRTETAKVKSKKRKPLQLPEVFNKSSFHLAKLAIVYMIAQYLSSLTGGVIHQFITALLAGIVFSELGFLERNALNHTASAGFVVFASTIIIFTNLAKTSPGQMISLIFPLIVCLGIGVIAVGLSGILLGKILRVSPYLAVSFGLTCTFGFPTTMLMPKEVANAMGSTPEEKEAIENYLLPKMVIAGVVTVTIVSVIIAGIVARIL